MRIKYLLRYSFILSIVLLATTSCGGIVPGQSTAVAFPTLLVVPNVGVEGNNVVGSPTPTQTSTLTPTWTPTLTLTPTPTQTPTSTPNPTPRLQGPYVVRQSKSLGGEKISGLVCSLTQVFVVTSAAPEITFIFNFVPIAADHGRWTYAYSIPRAGESHDANGNYTVRPTSSDGTLGLSMTGSDHVVFKGFDGTFPVNYGFDLVPSSDIPCLKIP